MELRCPHCGARLGSIKHGDDVTNLSVYCGYCGIRVVPVVREEETNGRKYY